MKLTPDEVAELNAAVPALYARRDAVNVREKGSDAVRTNFAAHLCSAPTSYKADSCSSGSARTSWCGIRESSSFRPACGASASVRTFCGVSSTVRASSSA